MLLEWHKKSAELVEHYFGGALAGVHRVVSCALCLVCSITVTSSK